ncbi:uncharacterized protein OCT59_008519 [Rhizophagus irregularis]|uniref:uncharacterized protein n=1 Tax=Rhizophagus irregularis TaxID=588596 RepID=UPI001C18FE2E|nr:hypothetical protein OCT59_008519 [Rhizophagus irregularis]CAB5182547.1 unnamed protein product [Rhizophagus irregularis]
MARTGKTLLNEKVRNQINSFYKRNNKYEENNEDNPKSELQLQIEKLVINCYQKSQELNNDCYMYEMSPSIVNVLLLFKKFQQIGVIAYHNK